MSANSLWELFKANVSPSRVGIGLVVLVGPWLSVLVTKLALLAASIGVKINPEEYEQTLLAGAGIVFTGFVAVVYKFIEGRFKQKQAEEATNQAATAAVASIATTAIRSPEVHPSEIPELIEQAGFTPSEPKWDADTELSLPDDIDPGDADDDDFGLQEGGVIPSEDDSKARTEPGEVMVRVQPSESVEASEMPKRP